MRPSIRLGDIDSSAMRFHISSHTKRRLANKFGYNLFLRLLLFKVWFRVAVLGFVLLLVSLALFLPKIWIASPRNFRPVVKISGLDKVQAWSLKRTARAELAAGNFERAYYAWLTAAANNPADVTAIRGLIATLARWPSCPPLAVRQGDKYGRWLLGLTGTNRADLALMAQFYDTFQNLDATIDLLAPRRDLQPAETALLLKALFDRGRAPEFDARWKQVAADFLPDPELPFYRAAFDAVWGGLDKAQAGRARLRAGFNDPTHKLLANRLELFVCWRLNDAASYREGLSRLQELGQDRISDRTRYWLLLYHAGRKDEARQLASAYPGQPRTAEDYIVLSRAFQDLDLPDRANACLRAGIAAFPEVDAVWLAYAAILSENRAWEDLGRIAVQLRTEPRLDQRLLGYSYYLEGWAEHELNRGLRAAEAFRRMAQGWVGHVALVLQASRNVLRMGYPKFASELLARFEVELKRNPAYWETLFRAANELKDPALLLKAAENEHQLKPDNPETDNRYAAALLINRQQADLAARLTLRLLSTYPNSVAARVNHGFALLLNHRTQEASHLLATIPRQSLTPEQDSSLALARFQVHYELGEYQQAWELLDQINSNLLFPTDLAWLEECRRKMPPRAAAN